MADERNELTPAERAALAQLERTAPLDPMEEERTVRRLFAERLLGSLATGSRASSRWSRPVRAGFAIAAGLACFLAGLWSGRSGVLDRSAETTRQPPSATPAPAAAGSTALVTATGRAPIIRF